eukprot:CAMPEP_0185917388 /NCGR_PEP_ID=MMETSP0924C-20121207/4535_1 /TAXON_ID=321610 /ORGANISM="Perkinsus chesapeaki, Strain ATCC PRA-65" /LENGTH=35 /DNA_ID= /DNA_START= /DNA_END= /DNA_ORIENTATION=
MEVAVASDIGLDPGASGLGTKAFHVMSNLELRWLR